MTDESTLLMPNFSQATHGFHHTVDSALKSLCALGISASRVTISMESGGTASGMVVKQSPPPGEPLGPSVHIKLIIGGTGIFRALPVGMWEAGDETTLGTKEIVEVFDDPVQKAAHWVREGMRLFDISRPNQAACARWISLFGFAATEWPLEMHYPLARLLPHLHRLRGSKSGIRVVLHILLNLPLADVSAAPAFCRIADADRTLLGRKSSRLGVDFAFGGHREVLARQVIIIGPVSLDIYDEYRAKAQQKRLNLALSLVLPRHRECQVRWRVLDPDKRPRFGREPRNTRLGVNFHLGKGR